MGIKTSYDRNFCALDFNVYEFDQYKIISRLLSYYSKNGNVNETRISLDPEWRILMNMIFDTSLLLPHFDCDIDFILKSKRLNPKSVSRSRQFVNVNLGNLYETFNICPNNMMVDEFINNIITTNNERYSMKPALLKIIHNVISRFRKKAFVKINTISDDHTDINNKLIDNEQEIYLITNKLLYNNYTPNISSLLLTIECPACVNGIYDNFSTEKNMLSKYFDNAIKFPKYEPTIPTESLKSYKIFLFELLDAVKLRDLLSQKNINYNSDEFTSIFYEIMIQIAYTLECFYRIGLVHNDLHYDNVFIEILNEPVNFIYVFTDESGEKIIKVIRIRTKYFVKILNFDKSYTFHKDSKYLKMKINTIPKITTYDENYSTNLSLARKYDFSYLCRWINIITKNKIETTIINKIVHKIIGNIAFNLTGTPIEYKISDHETENVVTKQSMSPFDWLINLNINTNEITVYDTIVNVVVDINSSIYILPDCFVENISNAFDKNEHWATKSLLEKINICAPLIKKFDSGKIISGINELCRKHTIPIYIDWVRHGESCANLDQKINADTNIFPNRQLGYMLNIDVPNETIKKNSIHDIDTKPKAGWMYEPNLSYIGIQHAILLGEEYIAKQPKYDVVICSPLTRTIMTAMIACRQMNNGIIYVVPYISEVQNFLENFGLDYQNVAVNSTTLKQRILFIKDWLERNWIDNFDDIEIMTDLYKVNKYLIKNGYANSEFVSRIQLALICKPKIGAINKNSDSRIKNNYEHCNSIIELILELLLLMNKNKLTNNFFYKKYSPQHQDNFSKFKRGIAVNFSILEKYEKIYKSKIRNNEPDAEEYNTRNPNIYKFYTEILTNPIFDTSNIPKRILCVAHGSLIRKLWQEKNPISYDKNKNELDNMLNAQVFRENINYEQSIFEEMYRPKKIRWIYQNFEDLNIDICSAESVKGIINFNLKEPIESYIGSFTQSLKGYLARETVPKEKMSFDVSFFEDDDYAKKKLLPSVLEGGSKQKHQQKYLKYKLKYSRLKQNMLNY